MQVLKKFRRFFRDMDKLSLVLTIGLFAFGLFSIVSASTREAVNNLDQSVYYYFGRQMFILLICTIAYVTILFIPTEKYRWSNYIVIKVIWIIVFGLNAWMIIQGTANRGANNWIKIPIINFQLQPGELAKPILIVSISLMLEAAVKYFKNRKLKHTAGIVLLTVIGTITAGLIILQKDLGTASIIVGIGPGQIAVFSGSPGNTFFKIENIISFTILFFR